MHMRGCHSQIHLKNWLVQIRGMLWWWFLVTHKSRLLTGISSTSQALSAQLFGTQLLAVGDHVTHSEIWCQLNWKFWGTKIGWFSIGFQLLSIRDSGDSKVNSWRPYLFDEKLETGDWHGNWEANYTPFWFENKHIGQYVYVRIYTLYDL